MTTGKPIVPNPDWKTLTPVKPDAHLYTEQSGYNDANVTGWDGRNVTGVGIGLIHVHANLPKYMISSGNSDKLICKGDPSEIAKLSVLNYLSDLINWN